jgi:hypothetical protein
MIDISNADILIGVPLGLLISFLLHLLISYKD